MCPYSNRVLRWVSVVVALLVVLVRELRQPCDSSHSRSGSDFTSHAHIGCVVPRLVESPVPGTDAFRPCARRRDRAVRDFPHSRAFGIVRCWPRSA